MIITISPRPRAACGEAEEMAAVALVPGSEKRLKDPVHGRLVHSMTGVRDRYNREASHADFTAANSHRPIVIPGADADLDPAALIRRLHGVTANIEEDLLQPGSLGQHVRILRGLLHYELEIGRQRGPEQ